MAYRGAALLLLAATAHLCFMSPHKTDAVSFSYDFSKASDQDKLWYGNDSSRAGNRIDITMMGKYNSTGCVAYDGAVRLWDDRTGERASFTTRFSFVIERSINGGGDGMAFFIGASRSLPWDSNSAFLGLFTNNMFRQATVGVEFDTFWNAAVDWEPQDITTDHVGIDVGNMRNFVNYTKDLANGSLSNGAMEANSTHNASSNLMVVTLQLANGTSVSLQATLDLKDVAGLGPDAVVGFSAATGGLVESHQLLSWSFSSTDLPSTTTTTNNNNNNNNNNKKKKKKKKKKIKLWVILLPFALVIGLLVAALLCYYIKHRLRRTQDEHPIIDLEVAREFSYNELSAATSNFSRDRELGAGSFGIVYRGELQDTRMVAVKKLTTTLMDQTRIRGDFVTEIKTLGHLSHRNVVKLLGWCSGRELLLVYELVANGSLEEHLHGSERPPLAWPERYKIVLGVGAAIDYLHNGCRNRILHRDIKPSNVMLDYAFDAKLGDFGLVRQLVHTGQSSLGGTRMIGTMAYMDPVCITSRTVSPEADMYSFGVLLLEIAAGVKQDVQRTPGGHLSTNTLVESVRKAYARGAILDMADKRLNGNFDSSEMERVLAVGLLCVEPERRHRPNIKRAVNLLSDLSLPVVNFLS